MSFELPEPWLSQLHPRRGGAGVRPVQPDPRAREVVDGQTRELPGFVPGVIAAELTDPELREAARDPASVTGAAVVAFATKALDWQENLRHPWFADLWLGERGLRFAAEAAVELFTLILVAEGDRPPRRALRRDGTETVGVRRRRPDDEQHTVGLFFDPDLLVLLRVRAALAAAPDDVHAEIVDALAGYRGRGLHARCATSVLVPSRADWVEQDWADALTEPGFNRAGMLLTAISTAGQAADARRAADALAIGWPGRDATVVDGLGPALAADLLLDWLDRVRATRADTRRELLSLIAVLPADEAMRGLVDRLGQRHVREALLDAAARFPERALRQLSVAAGKPAVSDLLSARVRADPALAERVAAELTTARAARIREHLSGVATVVPALPEALPPLLADPPWRRRRSAPVILDLNAPESPAIVEWLPGEREEWLSTPIHLPGAVSRAPATGSAEETAGTSPGATVTPATLTDAASAVGAGVVASTGRVDAASAVGSGERAAAVPADGTAIADRLRRGEPVDPRAAAAFFVAAPEELARPLLAEWHPEPLPGCESWMRRIVARFEVDALLPLRRLAFHDSAVAGPLMLPFTSGDIPWRMQVRLHDQGQAGSVARVWLERHPEAATRYLVPRAFGTSDVVRRSAQHTLVYMVAAGHVETLRAVAASYGAEAAAAVEALIVTDSLAILPTKLPAIPKWFDPAAMPPVRLRRPSTPPPTPDETAQAGSARAHEPAQAGSARNHESAQAGSARAYESVRAGSVRDHETIRATSAMGGEIAQAGSAMGGEIAQAGSAMGGEITQAGSAMGGEIGPAGSVRTGEAAQAGSAKGHETTPAQPVPGGAETAAGGPALVLPTGVLRELAMVFALHKPLEPYAGMEVVQAACEPGDLARFAWGVFEAWLAAGANGRQGWALDVLGAVGDDEVVRRLTPLIMEWPGQSGHARAVTGLGVLAEIGTEVALVHLNRIAERSRYAGLRTAAQRQVGQVAAQMGLTAEQLADRLVPGFGLDDDGSLMLDYGARSFTVRFDEELRPCVVDAAGKPLKNLPKPGPKDVAERAAAAYARFAALKKDVRTVAADQIRRLERAMVTGRRWPEEEFRRFLTGHRLLRHLARRLLWGRYDAEGVLAGAFRVAEDGTFADVHDEAVTIGAGEVIGVVHPIHLDKTLPLWSEIFADYRILQPFPQVGRETAALTEAEAAGGVLTRFQGRTVPSRAVLGLESRGWRRGTMRDDRTQVSVAPALADGLELELEPGIVHGAVDVFPEQTLGPVRLSGRTARLGDLEPVAISEVIRDLELLTVGH
ncbi:DUF4132 domain-containing protein [Actinoplanes sp. CA-252034]|uniref:DUF4132 domain-containing protein n=1 Tax=Actinoplanes sp. CA-252034 TaxID=3239906 RepID=UPI003D96ACF6